LVAFRRARRISTGGAAARRRRRACVRVQDMRNAMELVRGAGLSAPMCAKQPLTSR
jgi:hypothetical protein